MSAKRTRLLVVAGLFLAFCGTVCGQGLKGEYFTNMRLEGQPALTRIENVNFNWGGGSPGQPIGADSFSVRWTGSLMPPESGNYVFGTRTDDGVRLWVAGDQIISNWTDHAATWNRSVPIALEAGEPVNIRLEFYENGGDAVMEFYWSGPGIDEQIIPARFLSPTTVTNVKARKPNPANGARAVQAPLLEWTAGEGAIFHNVYLGTSPNLTEADLVAARQYFNLYYHVAGLTPGGTYYWRVDEIEKDGVTTHPGSVWSFTMQAMTAYLPHPADEARGASVAPTLTWLPGAGAVKHQVYFGNSREAVQQGAAGTNKGTRAAAETNYQPGSLESLTTYYWRVDEILFDGAVQTGAVWSFTTCLPVDDFESYTDDEGKRIYEAWIDGWTNNTGSMVGYDTAPFAERRIVLEGVQSMPLDYNNVTAPFYSETMREFTPARDWTAGGADTLVVSVRGRIENGPTPLYVALEDASQRLAVVAHPDPAITTAGKWTDWSIPLGDFTGVNAARIKKIYLGLGDRSKPVKGGAGRIYLDEIRVVKP